MTAPADGDMSLLVSVVLMYIVGSGSAVNHVFDLRGGFYRERL